MPKVEKIVCWKVATCKTCKQFFSIILKAIELSIQYQSLWCKILFIMYYCLSVVINSTSNSWFLIVYNKSLQTFLSEGHVSYYTAVGLPDILCNVIVSGYVTFDQIDKHFRNELFLKLLLDEMASPAGWNGITIWIFPHIIVWRTLV